ncbi:Lar family restriction alleviation protein [uncultured Draconibacterium sp.]|uniref:Lar family restriction alleviation protein n=1 Tax=uncultured Draconibacterium sp. TaxID=1573823 RepID=UPI0029C89B03|nr:Lar family restriction alleviation protein [uncultured Draconibacterium sp.]
MSNKVKLSPCPICGGKAKTGTERGPSMQGGSNDYVFAGCFDCGLRTKSFSYDNNLEQKAADLWNDLISRL